VAKTKQTTRPATENRDRRSALVGLVKRGAIMLVILMLPAIVISIVVGKSVRETLAILVAMLSALALGLLPIFVVEGLAIWFGWSGWAKRLMMKKYKQKLSALSDTQKAPFQMEQRCKPSPSEEVWVRHERDPQRGYPFSLEVHRSRDSGETWERLPLRLSPWARFKCIMLEGEWPPTSASRNLSCDKDGISLEVIGADYWDNYQNVWRATYRPRRKWWTLKMVGPLWLGPYSERLLRGENHQ
jgi:hypothetical protein